jgi:hypothetical protein
LEDVLSKEELRQLTEYAQLKSPTRATDPNPCREHGDLIEEAETKSTLADQDEAGEAQANVCMGLTAAISILSYFEPDSPEIGTHHFRAPRPQGRNTSAATA